MLAITAVPPPARGDPPPGSAVMVKDLVAGPDGGTPWQLTNVAGTLFFQGGDGYLWRSDGTEAGTLRVAAVDAYRLTASGHLLFFTANDGVHGEELWRSDGTAAGTSMVKDIRADGSSEPAQLTDVNGTLFFSADDGQYGSNRELWRSDGTAAGTVNVADLRPQIGSEPAALTNVGGRLFFTVAVDDNGTDRELYASDGAGAWRVKDINPGAAGSGPSGLVAMGGKAYFQAFEPGSGSELWRSDGSAGGTTLVKDLHPGPAAHGAPRAITVVGGSALYFCADDGSNGCELWRSDGTTGGTTLITDVPAGDLLTDVGGTLFFDGSDGTHGYELFKSDGTAAGTGMVKDIGTFPPFGSGSPVELTAVGGLVYFSADDGLNGRELWRSDGTEAGTTMVADIRGGMANSAYPRDLQAVGDTLIFAADDGSHGEELWKVVPTVTPPPDTTIVSGPAGTVRTRSVAFTFSSPAAGATFECTLDGAGWTTCASPATFSALRDGVHAFGVRAVAGGVVDPTPASRTFAVDATPPDTAIASGPAGTVRTRVVTFAFASPDRAATFACRLDAAAWTACRSPVTYRGVADGAHTFAVRATDAAGNTDASPAARRFAVDATAPATTIGRHPKKVVRIKGRRAKVTFTFASSEPVTTFAWQLDGKPWRYCGGTLTFKVKRGRHTIRVQAYDAAGNVDATPASFSWKVKRR